MTTSLSHEMDPFVKNYFWIQTLDPGIELERSTEKELAT